MRLISTTEDLAQVCKRLRQHDYVAVDTEFIREQTYWPRLCLIQLAGPQDEALVDPLQPGISLEPFFALMADERVVKVFHAARQDLEIVWNLARLIPRPIFDTQVAAMVCGFGEAVSYVNLVKQVTGRDLDKSSRFTDWSRRPLSQKQLVYALGDVLHLRDIYLHLKAELEREGRTDWLAEEMAELTEPGTYEVVPEEAWRRLKLRVKNRKGLAVLIELAAWRERLAQAQDVPRNRILRDEALYDIAGHAPTETAALSELRTLSEGFAKSARAKDIIEAVKRGLARDMKTVPPLRSGLPLPADKVALVDLLRVLLKTCAARRKVAPRLIADGDDLERIAVEDAPDVAALKGWRYEMFGVHAQDLKRGALALKAEQGEVVLMPLAPADGAAKVRIVG
jgi:ribonuclease D